MNSGELREAECVRCQYYIAQHVPQKLGSSRKNAPWITPKLRRMCRKKQRYYIRDKRSGSAEHWARFIEAKSGTARALRTARWDYINGILQEGLEGNNQKPFWWYIYSQGNDRAGVAPLKDGGELFSSSKDKAGILNRQFSSVFTADYPGSSVQLIGPSVPVIDNLSVSAAGVQKLLSKVNPSKAAGPDDMPCHVLKELSHELAPVLSAIYTISCQWLSPITVAYC